MRVITAGAATVGLIGLGSAAAAAETYEVQAGDTLSNIARSVDTVDTWQELHAANPKLDDPNLIFPGQVLELTSSGGEVQVSTSSEGSGSDSAETTTTTSASADAGVWDRLAQCESSGDWSINTGNGYYGGLQFSLSSWEWVGGEGYPHQASKAEQIHRAERLLERQGWGAWPACSSQLGLR
ncbi:transglycosylase family protein [Egicoccus sp. AB-alg2]|uniref:transglycosylase family protein n=1 Tax=Egicoccus sp. AB-alg2 TaxID=3242693 RepID=UPI00359D17B1